MDKPTRRAEHPPRRSSAELRSRAESHKAPGSNKPRGGRGTSTLTGLRFALYGQAGTWSARTYADSRNRQAEAARAVVGPHGGQIVAEYMDWGNDVHTRWEFRREAARLLVAVRDRARGFDAVIVGDTKLAFANGHYWSVFPFLAFHRMPLWIPELGGPIKYGNPKHEQIMAELAGPDPLLRHRAPTTKRDKEQDR